MNAADSELIARLRKDNTRFEEIYLQLAELRHMLYRLAKPRVNPLTIADVKAGGLRAKFRVGRDLRGEPFEQFGQMVGWAVELAFVLAAFAPEASRWRIQFALINWTLGGSEFQKRQNGGRRRGAKCPSKQKEYQELYKQFLRSGKSEREFCETKGISRSRLNRAIKAVKSSS